MERRCQPQNAGTWYETRRIIFQIIGVYTVLLLGVIVWQAWVVTPGLHCARFLEFSVAFWVLTVVVLVVIRRADVVNFVRPFAAPSRLRRTDGRVPSGSLLAAGRCFDTHVDRLWPTLGFCLPRLGRLQAGQ